jgi:hypothetical protein
VGNRAGALLLLRLLHSPAAPVTIPVPRHLYVLLNSSWGLVSWTSQVQEKL